MYSGPMQIAAVAVSATDLSRAVAFYELLGFRFPPLEAGHARTSRPTATSG